MIPCSTFGFLTEAVFFQSTSAVGNSTNRNSRAGQLPHLQRRIFETQPVENSINENRYEIYLDTPSHSHCDAIVRSFFWDRYYPHITLLKWVCCPAFAYLATQAWERQKTGWGWVLGTVAIFYNPIFQPHSVWNMWYIVIPFAIAIAVASIFVLNSKNTEK